MNCVAGKCPMSQISQCYFDQHSTALVIVFQVRLSALHSKKTTTDEQQEQDFHGMSSTSPSGSSHSNGQESDHPNGIRQTRVSGDKGFGNESSLRIRLCNGVRHPASVPGNQGRVREEMPSLDEDGAGDVIIDESAWSDGFQYWELMYGAIVGCSTAQL